MRTLNVRAVRTLLILGLVVPQMRTENTAIAVEFRKAEIVPDIIETGPSTKLSLDYGGTRLVPGQMLTPEETSQLPTIKNWGTEPGKSYTLILLDPDAISRKLPILRSFVHWLIVNISGSEISQGNVKATYTGPGPPRFTGLHRYVFLIWEQTQNIEIPELSILRRARFSMKDFVSQQKLVETPVAGNYFQCQATIR